jgi:hypothetical protein
VQQKAAINGKKYLRCKKYLRLDLYHISENICKPNVRKQGLARKSESRATAIRGATEAAQTILLLIFWQKQLKIRVCIQLA